MTARNPGYFLELFRRNPEVVRYLRIVIAWQLRGHQPWEWDRVKNGLMPVLVTPAYLDPLVDAGILKRVPDGRCLVDKENSALLEAFVQAAHELHVREATESRRRAELEAARLENDRRRREAWEHEQAEIREAEEARQHAAAEQERKRAESQRIWEHGTVEEVGEQFGSGDDVILQLLKRKITRREIVGVLRVGEHRVSRLKRQVPL